jgi:Tfp pilus assembly protein PilN
MKRINLLPPEFGKRRAARRITSILVVVGIVYVVFLGIFWVLRNTQLNAARDDLARARNEADALQAEVSALREFADLKALVDAKEKTLATAMVSDVHWSRILVELSMVVPNDSWLTSFAGTATPPQAAAPPGTAPTPTAPGTLGTISFGAVTFDFPGVASWLTRLTNDRSLQNIWVPNATKGQIGARNVVNFQSTSDLSSGAASNRYQEPPQGSP